MMRVRAGAVDGSRVGAPAICLSAIMLVMMVFTASAGADGTVAWAAHVIAEPTVFSASDALACEEEGKCDRYQLLVQNVGEDESVGTITVKDELPAGLVTQRVPESEGAWSCLPAVPDSTSATCTLSEPVAAGHYAQFLDIIVSTPLAAVPAGMVRNKVTIEGGGAVAPISTVLETPVNTTTPGFGVNEFAFEPAGPQGSPKSEAGEHPWTMTENLGIPVVTTPPSSEGFQKLFRPVENVKSVSVELPLGLIADAQATEKCEQPALEEGEEGSCPRGSEVGVFGVTAGAFDPGEWGFSGRRGSCCAAVYNMVPEGGYPAVFGFAFSNVAVYVYASVVHTPEGYRVRAIIPGIPSVLETTHSTLTLFGDPGAVNGDTSDETAFLSDPSDCSADTAPPAEATEDLSSHIALESWENLNPDKPQQEERERQAPVYSQLTGCGALRFDPSFELAPSPAGSGSTQEGSSQTDTPSAYSGGVHIPQAESFSEPATPALKDATITLPPGVTISPSAANGLEGCQEKGPNGINIGSDDIGPRGQDLGDPEATERGDGRGGGVGGRYGDGFYHTAPGHCPAASILGSVEACTPLLANRANSEGEIEEGEKACEEHPGIAPLQGRVFVAQPKCGGAGQNECTPASAGNGELYGLYVELEGDGVIVKLAGTGSANLATGQLTGTFVESPQFPFGDLRVHVHGGERAPLANPQSCGSFTAAAVLEPWSHTPAPGEPSGTPNATLTSAPFAIGGCESRFSPGFTAGTASSQAGGYPLFRLSFSREDGEQDLAKLGVKLPLGLEGKIADIPLCEEPQAAAGQCGPESQVGIASVLAGPGTEPLSVTGGRVYLTGPYGGGPFGLSIVVPAVAGPFNLGNEVVRAAIDINESTGQVTVENAIPQSRDGVPFRLRRANVEINHEGFMRNPTNCSPQQITGQITGAQGAEAAVASAFQATGCQSLPFKPFLAFSTQGKPSKAGGASLTVKETQQEGEADLAKVDLQLPVSLPSRLTTLQQACTQAQFAANPAGCPEGSDVGMATAVTPLLKVPLTGPAYLVARGGEFPDLEFVLQGEGVKIVLDGKTDIKHGITYSNFETIPDAPVTSFEASFPKGPHSVLSANGSLCEPMETITVRKRVTKRVHGRLRHVVVKVKKTVRRALVIPTKLVGQNGVTITQTTPITVTECPVKLKPKHKHAKTKGKKKKR